MVREGSVTLLSRAGNTIGALICPVHISVSLMALKSGWPTAFPCRLFAGINRSSESSSRKPEVKGCRSQFAELLNVLCVFEARLFVRARVYCLFD